MWDDLYGLFGASGEFKNWRGRMHFGREGENMLSAGMDNVCTAAQIGCAGCDAASIDTFRIDNFNSLIPLSSPLGQALASLDVSKDVIVSGSFVYATGNSLPETRDHPAIDTSAHFMPGNLSYRRPVLMVRFTSIAQAH